jgi:hypothetical protein
MTTATMTKKAAETKGIQAAVVAAMTGKPLRMTREQAAKLAKIGKAPRTAPKASKAKETGKKAQAEAPKAKAPKAAPPSYRVLFFNEDLWRSVVKLGKKEGSSARQIMHKALASELQPLVDTLRKAGMHGEVKSDHRCRTALDQGILDSCAWGGQQCGIAAVQVLRLCLSRYIIAKS